MVKQRSTQTLSYVVATKLIQNSNFSNFAKIAHLSSTSNKGDLMNSQITCQKYMEILNKGIDHILIDVRPEEDFKLGKLNNAINIPLDTLIKNDGLAQVSKLLNQHGNKVKEIYVICKLGKSSQKAVKYLKTKFSNLEIKDIEGGIMKWSEVYDPSIVKLK